MEWSSGGARLAQIPKPSFASRFGCLFLEGTFLVVEVKEEHENQHPFCGSPTKDAPIST